MEQVRIPVEVPLSLRATLAPLGNGVGPTTAVTADGWWRGLRTPEGPATLRLRRADSVVEATAWGPGSGWALGAVPGLVGLLDDGTFETDHRLVAELARTHRGIRLPRTGLIFETLLPTIVGQKVTGVESRRSMAQIVSRFSEPAPGPSHGLFLPPPPERLAEAPYYLFHPLGVEQRRAETIRRAARVAARLEALNGLSPDAAEAGLLRIPGVGPWTAANVVAISHGAPDAVPIGDYHLPNLVAWNLAGEPRATDQRMLELLEPFAGQRGRVIRWLEAAGRHAPAFGPRLPVRSFSRM